MNTYYSELIKTTKEFKKEQDLFLSGNKLKTYIRNTKWYKNEFWRKRPMYNQGQVVYAAIVQANTLLYKKRSRTNCPAAIVYSFDDYYMHHPTELYKISDYLYSFKNKHHHHHDIKQITEAISNEYQRLTNIEIPKYLTDGRQVYYTTIMVYRCHLPKRYLTSSVFPIVSDLENPAKTYIVPKKFWTAELANCFLDKCNLKSE